MKTISKHYIDLSKTDRENLLFAARDVDQGLSGPEYLDFIEALLNEALTLGFNLGFNSAGE